MRTSRIWNDGSDLLEAVFCLFLKIIYIDIRFLSDPDDPRLSIYAFLLISVSLYLSLQIDFD